MPDMKKILEAAALISGLILASPKFADAQNHNNRKNSKQQTELIEEEPEDVFGINEMTEQEKKLRLEAIPGEIDSLKKLAVEREENYRLVDEYITREFPMDKYNDNNAWKIPPAAYIRDSLMFAINKKIDTEKDSANIIELKNTKEAFEIFFNHFAGESFVDMTGISLNLAEDLFMERVRRGVNQDVITPEQAKVISQYLKIFEGDTRQPSVSKYDVIVSEINSRRCRDFGDLRIKYQNAEINPDEYVAKTAEYNKIYDLLFRIAKAANARKKIEGSNLYRAMRSLADYARWARISPYRFENLKDEEIQLKKSLGIYVPPQTDVQMQQPQSRGVRR